MKVLSFAKFCSIRNEFTFITSPLIHTVAIPQESINIPISHTFRSDEKKRIHLFAFDVCFGDMNSIYFTGPFEEVSIVIGRMQCTPSIN